MKKRILALLLAVSIVVGNGEFVYAVESSSGNTGTEQESTVESKMKIHQKIILQKLQTIPKTKRKKQNQKKVSL